MNPFAIASILATVTSGLFTVLATVFDQKDRNDEIDKRIDKKFDEKFRNDEASE